VRAFPLVVVLALLAACGASAKTATIPQRVALPPPGERPRPAAPADVVKLVGWGDARAVMLASGRWASTDTVAAPTLDAFVLERVGNDDKDVILALVQDGGLAGTVPLAQVRSSPQKPRSVVATLEEMPLGRASRALRVDVTTYEGGGTQLFAVKTTLIELVADRPMRVFDRLVESGNRVRDRRAVLTVKDVDGDGTPEIVVEERETGTPTARVLTYRRDRDGRFVTRDRSMFDD
jgi:hypothetical protein